MIQYISKKIILMLSVFFVVVSVTFFIAHMLPGDPVSLWVGEHPTKEQIEAAQKELGFDKPKIIQFSKFVKNLFKGDMGISLRTRQPVIQELRLRFLATLELVTISMFFSLFVGFPLAVVTVLNNGKVIDSLIRAFGYLGMSFPVFWLGMLLQIIFFGLLGWFPLQGRVSGELSSAIIKGSIFVDCVLSGNWALFSDAARHAFLPVLTMIICITGIVIRTSRSALVNTMNEPYFLTYKTFGFSDYEIIKKSGYKNTLVPISTVLGLLYGMMLGGTFFIESIFDWPGLGHFGVLSIMTGDFPSIIGVTIVYSASYILINFVVDILYFIIDPRVRI